MRHPEKAILKKQVEVYLHWREKNGCDGFYKDWLSLLVNSCAKTDVYDIREEDKKAFLDKAYEVTPTKYQRDVAEKAINGLLVFYGARGKNGHKRSVMGRPRHLSEIELIKKYRKMGLKYKEIERLTGKAISIIYRMIHY